MSDAEDALREARALVARLVEDRSIEQFSAAGLLNEFPTLRQFPSCVIDLAYEEYCRRRESGEEVHASTFVRQYSTVAQSLYRVIEFDQVLHDHPSLVEGVPEDRWPVEGDPFGGLDLIVEIGRGALSRVFIARQPELGGRQVVVKVCVRGEVEADFLGRLQHESIASIHSVHRDDATGLTVICMPLQTKSTLHQVAEMQPPLLKPWTGATLKKAIIATSPDIPGAAAAVSESLQIADRDTMPVMAIKWGISLAEALTYAHQQGVFHCDVKPGNVLILNNLEVQLLDFNLAASAADPVRLAGGTLPYMASEQLLQILDDGQEVEIGPATDVFGLCATLWHMVAGEPPYGVVADAASRNQAASKMLERQKHGIREERVEAASESVAGEVVTTLQRGLSFAPEDRFANPADLARALFEILPSEIQRVRRRRALATILVGLGAVAATGFVVLDLRAVEDARRAGHRLIADGQFTAAEERLARFVPDDQEAWFLALVARSCRLESLDYSKMQEDPLPNLQLIRGWQDLVTEWQQYRKAYPRDERACFNLAFVHLEFAPMAKAYAESNAELGKAKLLGLKEPRAALIQDILNLRAPAERGTLRDVISEFERRLDEVEDRTLTRGEFLCLIDSINQFHISPPGAASTRRLKEVAERLVACLRDPERRLAEPAIAKWIKFPNEFVLEKSELRRVAREAGRSSGLGEFNRLRNVLIGASSAR